MFRLDIFILITWVLFGLYWIASAADSKRNARSSYSNYFGFRVLIALLVIVLVHSGIIKGDSTIHNTAVATIGTVLFLAGLAFAIWARRHIGKNWGMPMSQKANPELVTSGPYHYVRHPIYSGILAAGLGTALAVGLIWLVVFVAMGAYFIFSAAQEEKFMASQFGKTYADYKHRTKMLIPFIF